MHGVVAVGATVVTADERELGKVKEVREGAFLVNAPRAFDYWVDAEAVRDANSERVTLAVDEAGLAAYKMDRPNDPDWFEAPLKAELDPKSVEGQTLIHGDPRLRP